MSNQEATAAQVTVARSLADSEDYYEMDACGLTYETCTHAGCIHLVLMDMAANEMATDRCALIGHDWHAYGACATERKVSA